tara:strand:+ start:688 stop:1071 length:384 start_codon:yes stop_codon:yes gene_type:complete
MYKIYQIVDNTNGNIYIGQTKQKYLSDRLATHKYDYKIKNKNGCVSREIMKNGDYKIELIEETDDKSRERYHIINTDCINKIIPGRTRKEWSKQNPDKRPAYHRSWGGCPRNNNMSLLKIDPDLFIL